MPCSVSKTPSRIDSVAENLPGLLLPNHHSLSSLLFACALLRAFCLCHPGQISRLLIAQVYTGVVQMHAGSNTVNGGTGVALDSGVGGKARAKCWL